MIMHIDAFLRRIGKWSGFDVTYFLKNGLWVTLRQAIGIIGGLLVPVAFAHLTTQEIFGQYQLILSILATGAILSVPGLNMSVIQSAARGYEGDYKRVVKISFFWSLVGVPILLLLGAYYYVYQNDTLGVALMISSVFFPFFYAPNTWDGFLQGKSRFDVSAMYGSIQTIITTIALIGVIFWSKDNLIPIVVVYLLVQSFFNVLYYFKSFKYIENNKSDKDTIRYGYFLTKMSVLGIIAENIDKLLVAFIISPASLAVYYIISVLPLRIKDVLKPFFNIFLPKFSVDTFDIDEFVRTRKKFLWLGVVFLVVISAGFYFSIERINLFLFGEKYAEFYGYAKMFSITILLLIPINLLGKYVYAKKNEKMIWLANVAHPVSKIVINVIFIYFGGIKGAVIAYNFNFITLFLVYVTVVNYKKIRD